MTIVAKLAERAAEAIRAANHATGRPGQVTVPGTAITAAELARTAAGLEQLCRWLAVNIEHRRRLGGLRHDTDGNPDTTITNAAVALTEAAIAAERAARRLDDALNPLSHLADTGTAVRR